MLGIPHCTKENTMCIEETNPMLAAVLGVLTQQEMVGMLEKLSREIAADVYKGNADTAVPAVAVCKEICRRLELVL